MKFIATVAVAASVLAVSSAQTLQISNPITGSQWTAGATEFLGWSSNCAAMGNSSHAVTVDLIDGPSTAVRFVSSLGTIDCSSTNTTANMVVPTSIQTGQYSIRINTTPQVSYSTTFQINNPSSPAATTTSAAAAAATTTAAAKSAGSTMVAGSLFTLVSAAVAAIQFAL
ncbi:hypothetical protein EDD21DRAFT_393887 [Dissophora ornata]|nr:hypothetical protein BGZ58_004323 [Dissophora ornata]KAI8594245.1 hypothetical protein EDD21DRAFT_393887 [Dissophora ornata]